MREIIFRGQSVDTKEWVEGYYCGENCEHPFSRNMVEKPYIIQKGTGIWFEVIPETVGQYTGLTDKNGKRIFEGDICWTDLTRPYNIVVFRNGCFMYQCEDNGVTYYDIMTSIEPLVDADKYTEVIGNIHDNPEPLGGDKE